MPREFRVKPINKGPVRRIRLRAVVAYPAISVALAVSLALVLTPFGAAQGIAVLPTPTETAIVTTDPPAPVPTTVEPTTVPTTAATTLTPTTLAPGPAATTAPGPVPNPTPGVDPSLAPALVAAVDHHVLAQIAGSEFQATYLAVDAPVLDASRFQTFRVRFQLHNVGTLPTTATPRLEYRPDGAAGFAVVPENPELGIPFYVAREWVPSLGGGTDQGPLGEDIAAGDLMMTSTIGQAATGHHSMGANPDAPITLPAASYTEQEFTVRSTMDAQYLTGYELRITDGGAAPTGPEVARIVLGTPPPLPSTVEQRQGVDVPTPTATDVAGTAYPLLPAPTTPPTTPADTTSATAAPGSGPAGAPLYALDSGSLAPVTVQIINPASTDGHGIGAGQCSSCHRGHTAKAPDLTKTSRQSTLCLSCHDGTGSTKNVKSQYTLSRPVNNLVGREYYSHDAVDTTTPTRHTLNVNEFADVENRHSECADCHNSHKAGSTDSVQTLTGWTASGRLAGVAGVSVANSPTAGEAPTYTFLSGLDTDLAPANLVTREYQLCFKCHSGFTKLLPPVAGKPSKDALDKAVEFNPANPSFHPVEAAGKNQTPKMALSLTGPSPYKLWNFEVNGTVRCLHCHATSATPGGTPPLPPPGTPPLPLPGSSLVPHTSSNRGILLRNYRDRVLKTSAQAYDNADFALCYTCHSNTPFATDQGGTDRTNFFLHGYHTAALGGQGSGGTDIDTSGAGQGNAICAECHFRLHSTKYKAGTQAIDGSRLVNFAPNVTPAVAGGVISWTPKGASTAGSCTLTCHGKQHTAGGYNY